MAGRSQRKSEEVEGVTERGMQNNHKIKLKLGCENKCEKRQGLSTTLSTSMGLEFCLLSAGDWGSVNIQNWELVYLCVLLLGVMCLFA